MGGAAPSGQAYDILASLGPSVAWRRASVHNGLIMRCLGTWRGAFQSNNSVCSFLAALVLLAVLLQFTAWHSICIARARFVVKQVNTFSRGRK